MSTIKIICKALQLSSAAISYLLFGLGAFVLGIFFKVVSFLPFLSREVKQSWIRWCIHIGCLAFINIMRLFGLIRYQFETDAMLRSKSGYLIIANHPSLIDVVLLFAAHKDLNCIVKGALSSNFFTGGVVRLAGFIPNNSTEVVVMAVEKLHAGEGLLIFPEGSRTKNDDVIRFKRGASNVAVAAGVPIIPVLIKCQPGALKKGQKWYAIPDGGANFSLHYGEPINFDEHIDTNKPKTLQYRELTRFLECYYKHWLETEMPPVLENLR